MGATHVARTRESAHRQAGRMRSDRDSRLCGLDSPRSGRCRRDACAPASTAFLGRWIAKVTDPLAARAARNGCGIAGKGELAAKVADPLLGARLGMGAALQGRGGWQRKWRTRFCARGSEWVRHCREGGVGSESDVPACCARGSGGADY
jgi:hypothetical protein